MKCQDEECINVGFNYLISKVALCIHPCGLPPLCLYPYHQKYKLDNSANYKLILNFKLPKEAPYIYHFNFLNK